MRYALECDVEGKVRFRQNVKVRGRVLRAAIQQCMGYGFPKAAMSNIYTVEALLARKVRRSR
jgi:hypothetical protein